MEPFSSVYGEVVAASILDDDLGHALWLTVCTEDEGEDVVAAGTTAYLSLASAPRLALTHLDATGQPTANVLEISLTDFAMERP